MCHFFFKIRGLFSQVPFDMPCYSLVSGKSDFLKFEDVLDELFEHHHSAPVADILGIHGEDKESSSFSESPIFIFALFFLFFFKLLQLLFSFLKFGIKFQNFLVVSYCFFLLSCFKVHVCSFHMKLCVLRVKFQGNI